MESCGQSTQPDSSPSRTLSAASRSKFVGSIRSIRPDQLGRRLGEDQPSGFELDGLSRLDKLIERMALRRMNAVGKKIRDLEAIVGLSTHAAGEERLERHVDDLRLMTRRPARESTIELREKHGPFVGCQHAEVILLGLAQGKVEGPYRLAEKFPHAQFLGIGPSQSYLLLPATRGA